MKKRSLLLRTPVSFLSIGKRENLKHSASHGSCNPITANEISFESQRGRAIVVRWGEEWGTAWMTESGFAGRELVKGGRPPMGQCYLPQAFNLLAPFFSPLLVSSLNQIHSAAPSTTKQGLRNTLISPFVCASALLFLIKQTKEGLHFLTIPQNKKENRKTKQTILPRTQSRFFCLLFYLVHYTQV